MEKTNQVVLLWEDEIAPAQRANLLGSEQFSFCSFKRPEEAMEYLVAATHQVNTLLIPESVPSSQRLAFLDSLHEQKPELFSSLAVLLLEKDGHDLKVRPLSYR